MRVIVTIASLLALLACGEPAAPTPALASVDAGDPPPADPPPTDAGQPPPAPPPAGPTIDGCPMFPADSARNRDVSADQVHPHSADYLAFMGAGSLNLHPDLAAPEYRQPFAVLS